MTKFKKRLHTDKGLKSLVIDCVQKMYTNDYHTVIIHHTFDRYEIHVDLVADICDQLRNRFKLPASYPRMYQGDRIVYDTDIQQLFMFGQYLDIMMRGWAFNMIVYGAEFFGDKKYQYTHRRIFSDLYGSPVTIKPLELDMKYNFQRYAKKYIHHPEKLNISSIYGEMKR